MAVFTFGMPIDKTPVDLIKEIIDRHFGLTEFIKSEGGNQERVKLMQLENKLQSCATELDEFFSRKV